MTCMEYLFEVNEVITENNNLLPEQLTQLSNTAFLRSIAYSLAVIADKLGESKENES